MLYVEIGNDRVVEVTTAEELAALIQQANDSKQSYETYWIEVEGDPPDIVKFMWDTLDPEPID